jgi:hypothetical protein
VIPCLVELPCSPLIMKVVTCDSVAHVTPTASRQAKHGRGSADPRDGRWVADLEQALDKAMDREGLALPRLSAAEFLQRARGASEGEAALRDRIRELELRLAAAEGRQ